MKIELLTARYYVTSLLWAIRSHPELWNQHPARTESPESPHHGLDDIWLRFAASGGKNVGGEEHESIWYPSAEVLGVKPVVQNLYERFEGKKLGGVLLTRIPPGATCRPHQDLGWHAQEYEKFALQIDSAPGQRFCFEVEELETQPGDVFWFNNQYLHWVVNPTCYERVTLIVCMKR